MTVYFDSCSKEYRKAKRKRKRAAADQSESATKKRKTTNVFNFLDKLMATHSSRPSIERKDVGKMTQVELQQTLSENSKQTASLQKKLQMYYRALKKCSHDPVWSAFYHSDFLSSSKQHKSRKKYNRCKYN